MAGIAHMTQFCYIGNFWPWKKYFIFKNQNLLSWKHTYFVMYLVEYFEEKVPGKVGECIFDT